MRRGAAGIITKLCDEGLEAHTTTSGRNDVMWRGIWPRDTTSPPGPVSVSLSFRQRVAVTVQLGHREWGL